MGEKSLRVEANDMKFETTLSQFAKSMGNIACLGLDPAPENVPYDLPHTEKIRKFFLELLDAMDKEALFPAMVKPNIAYFEKLGLEGLVLLKEIIQKFKEAGFLVTLDAKRGDIGHTSEAYAAAIYEQWGADATTVHAYFGKEGLLPFANWGEQGKGYYVLLRTSNPSAAEVQGLSVDGKPFYLRLLDLLLSWNFSGTGLVVGATVPRALQKVLNRMKEAQKTLPILIPGIGTQGGEAKKIMDILKRDNSDTYTLHRLNSSSKVLYAWKEKGGDPVKAATEALKKLLDDCHVT